METELIITLQEANQEIQGWVSKLSRKNGDPNYAALPPGELRALNGKLASVARRLVNLSPGQPKPEALQRALGEYLASLESLKAVLGKVEEVLSKHRDRLKKDLAQTNSARAWVEAYRATNPA